MSDTVIISMIGSLTSIVVALITLKKVNKVSKDVNGHMTTLLRLTKQEGKDEQKEIDGA